VSLLSGQFKEGSRILVDIDPEKNEPVFRLAEEQVPAPVS
jgi:hypothetical protein